MEYCFFIFIYDKFKEQYPFCALRFVYNHKRRTNSRKSGTPFWMGKAVCQTGDCISVVMQITSEPIEEEAVTVHVTVTGTCRHKHSDCGDDEVVLRMPNRRQLKGRVRQEHAAKLVESAMSANEMHMSALGTMSDRQCDAGNETVCQTPAVLRQAAYERRVGERLHQDVVMELEVAKNCWKSAMPGTHIQGYIQQLGLEPFHAVFYRQEQVEAYLSSCKSAHGAVLHLDATGSVM